MKKSWQFRCDLPDDFFFIYDQETINDICQLCYGIEGNEFMAIAMSKFDTDFSEIWLCIDYTPTMKNSIYEHISAYVETSKYFLAENYLNPKG